MEKTNKNDSSSKDEESNTISLKSTIGVLPILLFLIIVFLIGLYFHAINQVTIVNTNINEISFLNEEGFTVKAYVEISNPSRMSLKAKRIEYNLTLGNETASKVITDLTLPPRKLINVSIVYPVNENSSSDIYKEILFQKDTLLVLSGNIIMMDSPFLVDIPFEGKFDMRDELTDYFTRSTKDAINNSIYGAENAIKDLANGISDLFN